MLSLYTDVLLSYFKKQSKMKKKKRNNNCYHSRTEVCAIIIMLLGNLTLSTNSLSSNSVCSHSLHFSVYVYSMGELCCILKCALYFVGC